MALPINLEETLGKLFNSFNPTTSIPDELNDRIDANHFLKQLQETINVFQQLYDRYKCNEISVAFDGGKDGSVVLFLYYFIQFIRTCNKQQSLVLFRVVAPDKNDHFNELNEYVNLIEENYNCRIRKYETNLKNALYQFQEDEPEIKVVLMGNRRKDPYSYNMKYEEWTDNNWPRYLRVFPILNWTYHEVWYFLLRMNLPYCSLYDQGYTSLGRRSCTNRNEKLFIKDRYLAAYYLENEDDERHGRT
ncbi:hypothetical protein SNEBB_010635 [Seison nebaliae]|nr:hypothetical protein SNEBB_010635 [Seison nebaliae]